MMVSVYCLAYNHGDTIRNALEGFVGQRTRFDYEVFVHDDCSTDDTARVIAEYAERYPHIIKPVYESENQYSQGLNIFVRLLLPRMTGRYIAVCEGDDCWLDPEKLQKQVDFLESHPDYIGVYANVEVVDENGAPVRSRSVFPTQPPHEVTLASFKAGGYHAIGQFSGLMHRNYFADWPPERLERRCAFRGNGDVLRSLELVALGRVYFMGEVFSRYRYVSGHGDSWAARAKSRNMYRFYYMEKKSLFEYARDTLNLELRDDPESKRILFFYIVRAFRRALKTRSREDLRVFMELSRDFTGDYGVGGYLAQLRAGLKARRARRRG